MWEALQALGYSTDYPLPGMDLIDSVVARKNEALVQELAAEEQLSLSVALAVDNKRVDKAIIHENWERFSARRILCGKLSGFVDLAQEDVLVFVM